MAGSTGASFELRVAGLPSHSLSFTNCVYVNPGESRVARGAFVELVDSGHVFAVEHHEEVKKNEVAFNGLQRKSVETINKKFSQGSPVALRVCVPGDRVPASISMKWYVRLMSKRRAHVDEDKLADMIQQRYNGHVFVRNQQVALQYENFTLVGEVDVLKVANAEAKTEGDESVDVAVKVATLSPSTVLSLMPRESKLLDWQETTRRRAAQNIFKAWDFEDLGIGGLGREFNQIFRRAFTTRMYPPEVIRRMGIQHVKGMLLYGPPGTGKTLIAREIGRLLDGHEPQIVNGPEVLNKFVGQSEENIRELFVPAEEEQAERGDASKLHIIVFDELDAICKQRGSVQSGTGVHDTVVNQLLSKIDGVHSLNNLLVIGLTNRKDLIDSALLRPGRLEVHVEISLPDAAGRVEIFKIHTRKMRESGHLGPDVDLEELSSLTKNFSGAEIEGVVKSASSYALYQDFDVTKQGSNMNVDESKGVDVLVCMEHFVRAIQDDVHPAFGVAEEELENCLRGGFIDYGSAFQDILTAGRRLIDQVRESDDTPILSLLLHGEIGVGKTAIAAHLAQKSEFPFVRLISPEHLIGYSESGKTHKINAIFEDAYKSDISLIVIDNIERLLDYVGVNNSARFSNQVLQALLVLLKKVPPTKKRRMMIIATTSERDVMEDLGVLDSFSVVKHVHPLREKSQVRSVFTRLRDDEGSIDISDSDLDLVVGDLVPLPIGIQKLLMIIEMCKQHLKGRPITPEAFGNVVRSVLSH